MGTGKLALLGGVVCDFRRLRFRMSAYGRLLSFGAVELARRGSAECNRLLPEAHIIFLTPAALRRWPSMLIRRYPMLPLPLALAPAAQILTGVAVTAIAAKLIPERVNIKIKFRD